MYALLGPLPILIFEQLNNKKKKERKVFSLLPVRADSHILNNHFLFSNNNAGLLIQLQQQQLQQPLELN